MNALQPIRDRLESMKLDTGLDGNVLALLFALGRSVGKYPDECSPRVRGLVHSALGDLRRQIQPASAAATREGVEAFYEIAMAAFMAGEEEGR